MPIGHFNNDTGLFEYEEALDKRADWYEDEEGNLYIVPWDEEHEIEGPDTEEEDVLRAICRIKAKRGIVGPDGEVNVTAAAGDIGLHYVAYYLHRFTVEDGYYHA